MSALGDQRTLQHVRAMSALPPKADINRCRRNVRFMPLATVGHPYSICLSAREHGRQRRGGRAPRLLQVDGLIMPGLVELCTPHLMDRLVLRLTEVYRRPKPNFDVAEIFESFYQSFGVELRAISF